MKPRNRYPLIACVLLALTACQDPEIPRGYWESVTDRPTVYIGCDSTGNPEATVFHQLADGDLFPIRYPIVRSDNKMYIQTELRIHMKYSPRDSTLTLDPGGEYRFLKDSTVYVNIKNKNI